MKGRRTHIFPIYAFTILEVLIVVVVLAILATLLIPVISNLKARAQRVQCMANLRSLYTAAELYVQQNGSWPQIGMGDSDSAEQEYSKAWIAALAPFGPTQRTWICPTEQQMLGNPDLTSPENTRVDYMAMPFDDKPTTPHKWSRYPWFLETNAAHGNGQLMIFADGSITDALTVAATASSGSSGSSSGSSGGSSSGSTSPTATPSPTPTPTPTPTPSPTPTASPMPTASP